LYLQGEIVVKNGKVLSTQSNRILRVSLPDQLFDQVQTAAKLCRRKVRHGQQITEFLFGRKRDPAYFFLNALQGMLGQRIFFGKLGQFLRQTSSRMRGLKAAHEHAKNFLFHYYSFFSGWSPNQPPQRPAQSCVFKYF